MHNGLAQGLEKHDVVVESESSQEQKTGSQYQQ
jgi:hypothetical protein